MRRYSLLLQLVIRPMKCQRQAAPILRAGGQSAVFRELFRGCWRSRATDRPTDPRPHWAISSTLFHHPAAFVPSANGLEIGRSAPRDSVTLGRPCLACGRGGHAKLAHALASRQKRRAVRGAPNRPGEGRSGRGRVRGGPDVRAIRTPEQPARPHPLRRGNMAAR